MPKRMVVLGCYQLDEDGKIERQTLSDEPERPDVTPADLLLLEQHGVDELRALGFFGVLDRLKLNEITDEK